MVHDRPAFPQSSSFWRFPKTDVNTALGHMCNTEEISIPTLFGKNIPSTRRRSHILNSKLIQVAALQATGGKEKHIFPSLEPQTTEHDAQGLGSDRNALNHPRKETRSPKSRCQGDRVPKHHFLSRRSLQTTARASSPSDASQIGCRRTLARSLSF